MCVRTLAEIEVYGSDCGHAAGVRGVTGECVANAGAAKDGPPSGFPCEREIMGDAMTDPSGGRSAHTSKFGSCGPPTFLGRCGLPGPPAVLLTSRGVTAVTEIEIRLWQAGDSALGVVPGCQPQTNHPLLSWSFITPETRVRGWWPELPNLRPSPVSC